MASPLPDHIHQLTAAPDEPQTTIATVVANILARFPALQTITATMVLAHNLEYIALDSAAEVKDGDEVAFIPPIRFVEVFWRPLVSQSNCDYDVK